MSRIKKRGLDYFPMNTDFVHDRLVRRILKREGDAALAVLLQAFCSIYSGEGYYVPAGGLFYDDLADSLYQQEASDVERIIRLAVECGLFDAALFNEHCILTSADIQRQFLFITKRRSSSPIDARYNLLEEEAVTADATDEDVAHTGINVTEKGQTETFQSENSEKPSQSTQSIAKQSIAQQSKENSLLDSSLGKGSTEGADRTSAEEEHLPGEEEKKFSFCGTLCPESSRRRKKPPYLCRAVKLRMAGRPSSRYQHTHSSYPLRDSCFLLNVLFHY